MLGCEVAFASGASRRASAKREACGASKASTSLRVSTRAAFALHRTTAPVAPAAAAMRRVIQSRCQRHAATRVPPDRRRLRLRLCRPRLHLAAAAPSWNGVDGGPGGDTGVYIWNQWVFQHELLVDRHNPLTTDQVLSLYRSCRSLPAQLHRVPQSARAAADSVARCRPDVQYRVVDRERPDGARRPTRWRDE